MTHCGGVALVSVRACLALGAARIAAVRGRMIGLLVGTVIATFPALAETAYPSRTVQLIIAYGAGTVGDVSMRVTAERLSAKLGKPSRNR